MNYLVSSFPKAHRNICCACGEITYRSDFGDSCMGRCHACEARWESELISWSEPFWTETYEIKSVHADQFADVCVASSSNPDKKMLVVTGKSDIHHGVYKRLQKLYEGNDATYTLNYERFRIAWHNRAKRRYDYLVAEADKWCEQYSSLALVA